MAVRIPWIFTWHNKTSWFSSFKFVFSLKFQLTKNFLFFALCFAIMSLHLRVFEFIIHEKFCLISANISNNFLNPLVSKYIWNGTNNREIVLPGDLANMHWCNERFWLIFVRTSSKPKVYIHFQFFHIQFVFTGLLSTCTTALLGRWLIHILGKLNKKKYIIPRHFVSNGVNHHFSWWRCRPLEWHCMERASKHSVYFHLICAPFLMFWRINVAKSRSPVMHFFWHFLV